MYEYMNPFIEKTHTDTLTLHTHKTHTHLLHLGVDVEARVAELGNLLGQQFHAVNRVAEDNRLVDFQLSLLLRVGWRVDFVH